MRIIGIDPGPRTCGVVVLDAEDWPPRVVAADAARDVGSTAGLIIGSSEPPVVVCEWLTSYGLPVGATVLETALAVGRFAQCVVIWGRELNLVTRPDVALELTGTRRAKDSQIHEAVRALYRPTATGGGADPAKGTKARPGPLYGVTSHAWDALAAAVAWLRREREER